MEFGYLTDEELCDLMCGKPEDDGEEDMVDVSDCISRSHFDQRIRDAVGIVEGDLDDAFKEGVLAVLELLKTEPNIEEERRYDTAFWIHRNDDFNDWFECSNCGHGSEGDVPIGEETRFCPMCGKRMRDVR